MTSSLSGVTDRICPCITTQHIQAHVKATTPPCHVHATQTHAYRCLCMRMCQCLSLVPTFFTGPKDTPRLPCMVVASINGTPRLHPAPAPVLLFIQNMIRCESAGAWQGGLCDRHCVIHGTISQTFKFAL